MWTHFWDMSSGGGRKLEWKHIFIEANEAEAREFFEEAFGRDPDHVTCRCCGADYSVSEENDSIEQVTGYHRSCAYEYFEKSTGQVVSRETAKENWEDHGSRYVERQRYYDHDPHTAYGTYQTLAEYERREDVLILRRTKELGGARLMLPA